MKDKLQSMMKRQDGASAIEYALIAGLLAAILVGAITVMGGGFTQTFNSIVACMTGGECTFGA